jgi:quinol monooxygenase YgiN
LVTILLNDRNRSSAEQCDDERQGPGMIQAFLRIVAPSEKLQEILDVLRCLKGPTEVSKGCRVCRVLQDAEDEDSLTYLVQWETREDAEEHFRSERFRRLLPYIEMSVEPPEVEISDIDRVGGMEFLVTAIGAARGSL